MGYDHTQGGCTARSKNRPPDSGQEPKGASMTTTRYSYHIEPRSLEQGGGWRLRLLEDDTEAGGGVFPVEIDSDAGIAWWNKCSERERAHWLMMAASPRPAGAYHAYLLAETYADAQSMAYQWLSSRDEE